MASALVLGGSAVLAAEPITTMGLKQTLVPANPLSDAKPDVRRSRLAAIYVPEGSPVSPFFNPGPFTSTWDGYLNLEINDYFVFSFQGRGAAKLEVDGKPVFNENGPELGRAQSPEIDLRKGLNRIRVTYQSPAAGDAAFRLYWWNPLQPKEPIPPKAFACNPTDPALQRGERLRTGRWLFAVGRCIQCHAPGKDFGPNAMPELQCDSPDLTGIGGQLNQAWMAQWLMDPQAVRNVTQMPRMLHGGKTARAQEARDIAAYLASLNGNQPASSIQVATLEAVDQIDAGQTHFEALGCMTCHFFPGDPPLENEPRLSLAQVKAKWKPAALVAFLQNPARHYQWIRMPNFQLSLEEATALAAYVLANADSPPAADEGSADPQKGRQLVTELGCVNCHTIEKMETQLTAPPLKQVASITSPKGCLTPAAAHDKRPEYALSDPERQAVVDFLQSGLPSLRRHVWNEFANRQFKALQCVACHAREDQGDRWAVLLAGKIGAESVDGGPDTTAPADDLDAEFSDNLDDEFGDGTDETAGGGGQANIHAIRPPLNFVGEKLNPDWMETFIAGKLDYKPRVRMKARMPSFPVEAHGLAVGFALDHGFPPRPSKLGPAKPELAKLGKELVQANRLGCVSCHALAEAGALSGAAAEAINLQYVPGRLRPHYFKRYVLDPQRVLTVTMMPKFPDEEGKSPITDILAGDAPKQFEAIWEYLRTLTPAR